LKLNLSILKMYILCALAVYLSLSLLPPDSGQMVSITISCSHIIIIIIFVGWRSLQSIVAVIMSCYGSYSCDPWCYGSVYIFIYAICAQERTNLDALYVGYGLLKNAFGVWSQFSGFCRKEWREKIGIIVVY
jgi:hypothetical protein